MTTLPALRRAYLRLSQSWPTDPLRPELPFSQLIRTRSEAQFTGSLTATPATKDGAVSEVPVGGERVKEGEGMAGSKVDLKELERGLFALNTLLEGRYSLKYPVSQKLTRPRSQPDYYEKLLLEIEMAPKRSWLARKIDSWRGWVRWN